MSNIEILPVENSSQRRHFVTFPWQIYKNDPLWVPPLVNDRLKFIDPAKGVFFKRGIADFFTAFKDGKPVGTICCADDRATNAARGLKDCLIGFFECIQDEQVALAMFDHARKWATTHGLNSMYGPFNLDYEDGYGVLLEEETDLLCYCAVTLLPTTRGTLRTMVFNLRVVITLPMKLLSQWQQVSSSICHV